MNDHEDAAHQLGRPLPLIAVLLGIAALAAAALILPRIAPPLPRGTFVGAGAAVGLLIWALALLVGGLRRGPSWWVAASAGLLIASGALAGFNASRIGHAGTAADASTFAELELASDGAPVLPSNPARGPISKAYADLVRADAREAQAFGDAIGKLNPGVLNSPYNLAQSPAILRDCRALGSLANQAAAASARRDARVKALVAQIATAQLSDPVRQGTTQMVTGPDGAAQALLDQERELWAATQSLCELLAKRSWSNANGFFGFASTGDKAAFDALNHRRVVVESERKRIRDAARARFEEGREQVRAALS